jgi:hypothetical protein
MTKRAVLLRAEEDNVRDLYEVERQQTRPPHVLGL